MAFDLKRPAEEVKEGDMCQANSHTTRGALAVDGTMSPMWTGADVGRNLMSHSNRTAKLDGCLPQPQEEEA